MGNLATPEALIARWDEVCRDPSLQDLPYKIELNAWGKIETSPASNRQGRLKGALSYELMRQLPDGTVLSRCSILTGIGVCVPDLAWASRQFISANGETAPYRAAPEICVEITSPDIERKARAYFATGAQEVWVVSAEGSIRYFDPSGEKAKSDFPVLITLPPPMKSNP